MVACSHKIDSACSILRYPPGCYPMSKSQILRLLPHYVRLVAVSPVGLMKLFRAQTTLNGFRPKEPHCHGYFLDGRQATGCGFFRLFNFVFRPLVRQVFLCFLLRSS